MAGPATHSNGFTLKLTDFPEFLALLARVEKVERENVALRARQLKWVNTEQAEQVTGLSGRTLMRERQRPGTLLIYKADHGIRYDYDSLIRHNESRALGRGRMRALLSSASPQTS